MKKTYKITLFLATLFTVNINAQYTETINSNSPGMSQGAYSVGTNVWQAEGGFFYSKNKHELRKQDFAGAGVNYQLRYGFWKEELEINLSGSFQTGTITDDIAGNTTRLSNFKVNTLGAKYLVYNPYRNFEDKPNLKSWRANHKFKWRTLLPSVSVYAGMNFNLSDTPFVYGNNFNFMSLTEPSLSPKIMVITQHNWSGGWVFTMNFIGDRMFMTDYPIYSYILTLTHSVGKKIAVFGEHQGIMNDIYADSLFRFGSAYLFSKDIQVDLGVTVNTKNTPSIFGLNLGLSYRLDFHEDPKKDNNADEDSDFKKNALKKSQKKKKNDGEIEKEKKSEKDENEFDYNG